MCELIRAAYAGGRFSKHGSELNKLNPDFVDSIDCVGAKG